MHSVIKTLLEKYSCASFQDYTNSLKEIFQEIALLGLWRAKFFEHAAFYGGTALRILYGLNRFSEDMDFSLLDHHISRRPLLLDKEISFEDFEEVFLEGKKKLRKLRAKLIIDFLRNNKMNTIKLISRDPRYYMKRVTKQLFKQ